MRGYNHYDDLWLSAVHMGGGGSGNSTTTSTQNSIAQPWSGQMPYLTGSGGSPGGLQMTAPGQWSMTPAVAPTQGVFPAAAALYNNQSGWPQYFPSSTYAPLTGGQQNIINQITGFGTTGSGALNAAGGALSNILGPGATNQTQGAFGQGQDYLSAMLSGQGGTGSGTLAQGMSMMPAYAGAYGAGAGTLGQIGGGLGQYSNAYGQGAGGLASLASPATTMMGLGNFGQATGALGNYLSPNYLNPQTNPGFQSLVNNTLANVIPATSASFINGGRTDSGLAQRAQTMGATDAIGQLEAGQYNQNVAAQQAAAAQASGNLGMLGQLQSGAAGNLMSGGLQGTGLAGTAAGNLGQLGLGGINAAQGAAGTAAGLQQSAAQQAANNYLTQQLNQVRGAAVAPGIDQQTMADLTGALTAQGMTQQDAQQQINAAVQAWNYNQTLPWNMLSQYQNMVGGTGFGSQTSGSTTTPSNVNQTANLLSGGLGGAAAGGMLGSALGGTVLGMGAGPFGALAGAGVGLIGSLLNH